MYILILTMLFGDPSTRIVSDFETVPVANVYNGGIKLYTYDECLKAQKDALKSVNNVIYSDQGKNILNIGIDCKPVNTYKVSQTNNRVFN